MEVRQGGIENKNLNTFYSFEKLELSQHNILPLKKMFKFRRGCMDTAAMQNTDAFRK